MPPSPGRAGGSAAEPPPELLDSKTEATVDALLETVRHLLEEESARDQSFNARGVGIAGFVGIVVSLSAALGRDALSVGWDSPWKGIAVGLFAGALTALLSALVILLAKVLMPKESVSLSIEEVERYPLPEFVYAPKVMNQGSTLRGLIEALVIQRARASSKAGGLHWSYRLVVIGLTCISILGFLLGLHEANLLGARHAKRDARPAILQSTCGFARPADCLRDAPANPGRRVAVP